MSSVSGLREFYRAAFDGLAVLMPPASIEVSDLGASLSRIWDFGGSIVAIREAPTGEPVTATVRDPAGNLVQVVETVTP